VLPAVRALEQSAGLFTILPVRGAAAALAPGDGVPALLCLPVIGAVIGAAAGFPAGVIRQWAPHAGAAGPILAVAALAILTRCLHLDGLADTADGLGSRAPAERALEIMRKSDIGPFGVVTLVLFLLLDVAMAGASPGGPWTPVAVLAIAAATGRVAAVQAAQRGVPAGRSSGFGTLVADGIPGRAVAYATAGVLAFGLAVALLTDLSAGWVVGSQVVALGASWLARRHVVRRLGGTTGDVFGALIELATAITLLGIALS
jgi:adenosylcobinamide-GDP ribazoletransferase